MEFEYEADGCFAHMYRPLVCVLLSLLFGLQVYTYFWSPQELVEGDFSDVKYALMQLTRGLSEVNRKHEKLQDEMERISETLPAVAAAAGRAKEALEPMCHGAGRALAAHDYDRQIADYALETAGGRIVDTGDTVEHIVCETPLCWIVQAFSSVLCRENTGAATMIRPGSLPGECWAFKGAKGEATIRLIATVHVTGVSIEHIPTHITPTGEIPSAPRLFQLEGLETRGDPYPHDFGTFEYDKNGKPNQHFDVIYPSTKGCNLVRIRIYSNWGHSVYTCVYRVRVHGETLATHGDKKDDGVLIDNE